MRTLGIVGGRSFNNYNFMCDTLDALHFDRVVSAGGEGTDNLAEKYAWEHNKKLMIFGVEWDKFHMDTVSMRNQEIVEHVDGICAFWDGVSVGTQYIIKMCQDSGKPVKIIGYK